MTSQRKSWAGWFEERVARRSSKIRIVEGIFDPPAWIFPRADGGTDVVPHV